MIKRKLQNLLVKVGHIFLIKSLTEILLFFETVFASPIKDDNPLPKPFLFLKILLMLLLQNSILEPKTPL